MIPLLLSLSALAGYGDPIDGLPTYSGREVHLWTNMVRVDPAGFDGQYPCSFSSFSSGEQTPRPPLLWNLGLNQAADFHSGDMNDQDYFSHDSIDGTPWSARVNRYYRGGWIAENIAWGYSSPYAAVVQGWMCSSGHRANIMGSNYDELGAGVVGAYYTQNFGYGGATPRAIAMGVHLPRNPSAEVDLAADFYVPTVEAPVRFEVILDGEAHALELINGVDTLGVWGVSLPTDGGCHLYYFEAETASGAVERFPEDGSYGWGDCAWDDPDARWVGLQEEVEPPEPDETDDGDTGGGGGGNNSGGGGGGGSGPGPGAEDPANGSTPTLPGTESSSAACDQGGSSGSGWLLLLALLGIRRRR